MFIAIRTILLEFYARRMQPLIFLCRIIAMSAFSTLKCDYLTHILTAEPLLDDLSNNTGTNSMTTFANSEAQLCFHGDGLDQFDR